MTSRSLPSRIGRYEVVDRLGAGGMGVLYLARDPLLRRTLAIKVLAVDDEDLRERFSREARSAAALSHTNIVTIFDVGEDSGHPFLAMEYLDGETMAEMIRRKAPVALQRRLQLLLELCAGLGYAHRLGIIHRDIKPANLMITGNGTLKILDFGLARLTHDHASGLTQSGALLGTPHYMSPEQIEGRPVDHRSDIFSVGLVLYELLTYKKAFSGEGMHVVLHKITHERPQPIREVDPTLDPALERIVDKATEREPDHRYQSLEMMAADATALLKALAGRPDADATVIIRRDHLSDLSARKPDSSSGARTPSMTPRVPNFEGIARRREAQIQLHLDEAMRHFNQGQLEQAIEQCELAAVLNPEEPRVFDLLSRAHGALDDQQIAAWLADARTQLAQGAFTRAEALVQQSLERRPALPEAQALRREIGDARRAQEQIRERQRAVAHAVERARAHMAAGALDAAVRAASEALAFEPGHGEAESLKQQALETLEAQRRELEHEQRASDAAAAATAAVHAGDLDGAAALLDAFAPPHPIVSAARADVERRIDARRKAVEQASSAKNTARAAITAGQWASAEAALNQAASLVPNDAEIVQLEHRLADARAAAEAAAAEREREAREQAEREARENAERERLAREEADRKVRDKAEQEAREKAEREARENAERERLAREEADRKAREKAEQDAREQAQREARENAERERLAREEADRKTREKAEQETREKAEREARGKAERERLAREEADRKAREKAEQETREKAEREAREKADRERLAREEADRKKRAKAEQDAREKAEREAREKAEQEAREQAQREAREKADRERLAREEAERKAREASEREAQARTEQEARDRAELEAVDRSAREQRAREDALALSPEDETRPAVDRSSPMGVALEAARQEALQRSAARQAEARTEPKGASPVSPPPTPGPARAAAAFPLKWVAVIVMAGLVAAAAAFVILGRSRSPNPKPTTPATTRSTAVSPADVLREVRRLAGEGHPERALDAAVKGYRDTHDQVLAEYISSARAAAAKTAADAAAEASGTDAAKRAEYSDAAAKFQQAAGLTHPEDAPRAVALYADAEKEYRAAVTASTNDPAVFVQKATDAYKNGAVDRAVEYALTARRLDPSHAASDKLIDQIRRDASREAARARSAAVAAGATGTDEFGRAEKRARDASRTTSPDELLAQVTANKEAVQLYRASATAAENARAAHHQTAEQHVQQARVLISQKRLDDAESELRQARTAEPDNAAVQAVDRQLADARRAAKAEELNTRITSLLQQSRGVDARQAIPLLQQASALDPSRDDVKRELQRRNDELTARPAPPVTAPNPPTPPKETGSAARAAHDADIAAINQVLERYWAAWDALDIDAIRAVYPSASASTLRGYFKSLKSQQTKVQSQTPEIDSSGTAATVRCRVTSHPEARTGTMPDSTKNAVLSFAKVGNSWRIMGLQYLQ